MKTLNQIARLNLEKCKFEILLIKTKNRKKNEQNNTNRHNACTTRLV